MLDSLAVIGENRRPQLLHQLEAHALCGNTISSISSSYFQIVKGKKRMNKTDLELVSILQEQSSLSTLSCNIANALTVLVVFSTPHSSHRTSCLSAVPMNSKTNKNTITYARPPSSPPSLDSSPSSLKSPPVAPAPAPPLAAR